MGFDPRLGSCLIKGGIDSPNFEKLNNFNMLWKEMAEKKYGGETGIRTLETVTRLHAFQACAFDHSATSPYQIVRAL